jgi:hypothetical protein
MHWLQTPFICGVMDIVIPFQMEKSNFTLKITPPVDFEDFGIKVKTVMTFFS